MGLFRRLDNVCSRLRCGRTPGTHPAALQLAHFFKPNERQSRHRHYFSCIGLAYIMVEVGLIAYLISVLNNATVSVLLLLPCMLIFSGLGSLVAHSACDSGKNRMPSVRYRRPACGYAMFLAQSSAGLEVRPTHSGWCGVRC